MKLSKTIYKETAYIAIWTIIFSVLMNAVFLIVRKWNLTVLWGNLLSFAGGVLNFFLLGVTVQKALDYDEKKAKTAMKLSQSLRLLMLFVFAVVGVIFDCFNIIAVLLPLLFPRIAIAIRPLFDKKMNKGGEISGNTSADDGNDGFAECAGTDDGNDGLAESADADGANAISVEEDVEENQ
ncbi:MAG: ATP synthase subunit I [Christensenellales bacterium]